jgi:hypothetical protein
VTLISDLLFQTREEIMAVQVARAIRGSPNPPTLTNPRFLLTHTDPVIKPRPGHTFHITPRDPVGTAGHSCHVGEHNSPSPFSDRGSRQYI